jgi:hypothetical protein
MAITLNNGRQWPLVINQDLALADFTSTVAETIAKLPVNSVVTGGYINVTEVWNSTTSDALDIGHSDDDDEYTTTPVDLQALGVTALVLTGYKNTGGLDLIGTWTSGGGTPTTGTATLYVEYIIADRATEIQTT